MKKNKQILAALFSAALLMGTPASALADEAATNGASEHSQLDRTRWRASTSNENTYEYAVLDTSVFSVNAPAGNEPIACLAPMAKIQCFRRDPKSRGIPAATIMTTAAETQASGTTQEVVSEYGNVEDRYTETESDRNWGSGLGTLTLGHF